MTYLQKQLLTPLIIIGTLLFSSNALADAIIPITGNTSFNIIYSMLVPVASGIGPITLNATSTWTVTNFTSTSLDLTVAITNTTILQNGYTKANIMSFGFNGNPTVHGTLTTAGTVFDGISSPGNLPSIDNTIDVCVWAGNNCSGGSINNGLSTPSSDSVKLHLTYASTSLLTLSTFGIKWQTTGVSYAFTGCLQGSSGCGISTPEPESALLLLGGLGFITFFSKRQRSKK